MSSPSNTDAHNFQEMLDAYKETRIDLILTHSDETETFNRLVHVISALEDSIIQAPCPDLCALLAKLEIASTDGYELQEKWFAKIREDVRQMAGLDHSPTFLPEDWLRVFNAKGGSANIDAKGDAYLTMPMAENAAKHMERLEEHNWPALRAHIVKIAEKPVEA